MISLNIGRLDQWLTLLAPVVTEDALGEDVATYVQAAQVWGAAEPLRGRELLMATGPYADATVRFRIRHRADVLPTWRVQWRGVDHAIVGDPIDVLGQRTVLEIMTRSLRPGT